MGFGWQATDVDGRRVSPEAPQERRETGAMWYVYFLQLSNNDIYVGSTNDLRRRVKSHADGHVLSTKAHLPIALKSYIAVETEALARALERYFKSGSGKAIAKKRFLLK
jgi:predicted GIY-YIG superfamily endonuclease